jgi:1-acyl-sn-glycerol-3-phosphate acyltransferase
VSKGGINSSVYWVTRIAARLCLAPFFSLERKGLEHLPKDQPCVLLPKHQRWEDIPLLGLASPYPLYYVAKYELFTNPLSDWFIRSLGGMPLNRLRPMESRWSIKEIFRILERGEKLVVFPEGTYYRGQTGPGHSGMIRVISSRMKVPFYPVGVNYSHRRVRKPVRICFGEAMTLDQSGDVERFTSEVMIEIGRLSNLPENISVEH